LDSILSRNVSVGRDRPALTDGRDDVAVLHIPRDCVGYITGTKRATLSRIEDDWGAFMMFLDQHRRDGARGELAKLAPGHGPGSLGSPRGNPPGTAALHAATDAFDVSASVGGGYGSMNLPQPRMAHHPLHGTSPHARNPAIWRGGGCSIMWPPRQPRGCKGVTHIPPLPPACDRASPPARGPGPRGIFGLPHGRRGAELKVMSTVEGDQWIGPPHGAAPPLRPLANPCPQIPRFLLQGPQGGQGQDFLHPCFLRPLKNAV